MIDGLVSLSSVATLLFTTSLLFTLLVVYAGLGFKLEKQLRHR